jgi:hypothetical protein
MRGRGDTPHLHHQQNCCAWLIGVSVLLSGAACVHLLHEAATLLLGSTLLQGRPYCV